MKLLIEKGKNASLIIHRSPELRTFLKQLFFFFKLKSNGLSIMKKILSITKKVFIDF